VAGRLERWGRTWEALGRSCNNNDVTSLQ
jgi:hypothetical protein